MYTMTDEARTILVLIYGAPISNAMQFIIGYHNELYSDDINVCVNARNEVNRLLHYNNTLYRLLHSAFTTDLYLMNCSRGIGDRSAALYPGIKLSEIIKCIQ